MKKFLFAKTLAVFLATCSISLAACQNGTSEEQYSIKIPDYTPEYNEYKVTPAPSGVNMSYYSDIFSRGFSWVTDTTVEDTKLYLVESDKGQEADFANAELKEGETTQVTYDTNGNVTIGDGKTYPVKKGSSNSSKLVFNSHKVHVENLKKGKAYSYKLGSDAGWHYGAFIVEKENNETITAVHMSDAQTIDHTKLGVWRNTFVKSVITAGSGLDMALYNGDQFDQNMEKIDGVRQIRFITFSKALDVIQDYKASVPYMSSSGNHEPAAPYSHFLHLDTNYPSSGVSDSGCYYSYDYNFAHFVVLNSNGITSDNAQLEWLKNDLDAASNAKWKIVMMHISPYSTGDHSNKTENQNILKKLTPIFSAKHVDLVLQAHDHTYNKTLPYKWDAAGYTTIWNNAEVVNLNPETETKDNIVYDKNPQGTYYVTTGAAGHRYGEREKSDGIWADVYKDGDEWKGLDPKNTFLNNTYKIELGKLKYANQYASYKVGSYTSAQNYQVGDLASGNVNAPMFGVLELSKNTLSYKVYTAIEDDVRAFDSLDILKA